MKGFLLFCFLIAALWDGATTVLGTAVILRAQEPIQYGFCVASAIVVLGLGFGSRTFLSKTGCVYLIFKIGWGVALLFDIFTSFMGNARYIVLKQSFNTTTAEGVVATIQQMDNSQFLVVVVMTLLVSGSPAAYSFIDGEEDMK